MIYHERFDIHAERSFLFSPRVCSRLPGYLTLVSGGHRVPHSSPFKPPHRPVSMQRKCSFQVMINGIGIVGFRDPHGIRPLVFGARDKSKVEGATKDYVVSSESVVMDMLGFELTRECFPCSPDKQR